MRVVGYCSTTTYSQNINTQKKAILAAFPEATIMIDHRNHDDDGLFEKKWDKIVSLNKMLVDVVVLESVTRMKADPDKIAACYEKLYGSGVEMVFLKDPELNSEIFRAADQAVESMDCDMDSMFRFKDLLKEMRRQQIEAVVKRSIEDLESRSELAKQSVKQARESGKTVGRQVGAKVTSTKEAPAKELIKAHDKHFVKDPAEIWKTAQIMEEAGISRPTYRKYLKDLMQEQVRMAVLNKFRQKQMAAQNRNA